MRFHGLLLMPALVLAAAPAGAQTPPATPPAAPPVSPAADPLDRYLQRWEEEMVRVQTLAAQLERVEKDKTFNDERRFVGYAQYMKVGSGPSAQNLFMLEFRPKGKNEISEKLVSTGTFLYEFMPALKEIRVRQVPQARPGQAGNDNFLSFLLGMRAEDAKKRYQMRLAKEDQWYVYVDVLPRHQQDKADFVKARIVLNKQGFLPRQLWFEHPNGSEITWDIPAIRSGVQINRTFFDPPKTPTGWKVVPIRADTPAPRVIRGQ